MLLITNLSRFIESPPHLTRYRRLFVFAGESFSFESRGNEGAWQEWETYEGLGVSLTFPWQFFKFGSYGSDQPFF